MKHEKPVGKVKPEKGARYGNKTKPTRHRFGLGRFLFDLGRFGMSAVSTSSQFALIFYKNLFTFNIA